MFERAQREFCIPMWSNSFYRKKTFEISIRPCARNEFVSKVMLQETFKWIFKVLHSEIEIVAQSYMISSVRQSLDISILVKVMARVLTSNRFPCPCK